MRHKRAPKREILPDSKYNRVDVAKFINYIMRRGKKSLAEKIVYKAFEEVNRITNEDPLKIFDEAIKNISPLLEVKSRRIGGANYQIPVPVPPHRRFILASRWIIEAAKNRKGKPMFEKLAEELIAASKGEGAAFKKKQDVHRMAEANKAFAHFIK
jgi:small subunit ribosomal protein S7